MTATLTTPTDAELIAMALTDQDVQDMAAATLIDAMEDAFREAFVAGLSRPERSVLAQGVARGRQLQVKIRAARPKVVGDYSYFTAEADAIAYLADRWPDTSASVIDARIQAAQAETDGEWWDGITAIELAFWLLDLDA